MKFRTLLTLLFVCIVSVVLVSPTFAGASHNPGNPRNDTVSAGAMQCNTNTAPVTKAGQTTAPSGQTLFVIFNQDQGHLRLEASGSAIGPLPCTFGIVYTHTTCTGASPTCQVSNVQQTLCSVSVGNCNAVTELDFVFEFTNPVLGATTHQYIHYDLVVWTGSQPLHTSPVVVASGVVHYYEPPSPVPLDGIEI